jgi:LysM repeat protein
MAALGMLLLLPGVRAQESSPAGSTFPDTAWDCSGWHTVIKGDSCPEIEKKYNITSKEFLGWNPSVSKDCKTNFKEKYSYCVRVGAPGPTQKGIAANCDKWHTVKEGDDCKSIEKKYKITADQFFKWNPAVSKDCVKNFWVKYSYCVR